MRVQRRSKAERFLKAEKTQIQKNSKLSTGIPQGIL